MLKTKIGKCRIPKRKLGSGTRSKKQPRKLAKDEKPETPSSRLRGMPPLEKVHDTSLSQSASRPLKRGARTPDNGRRKKVKKAKRSTGIEQKAVKIEPRRGTSNFGAKLSASSAWSPVEPTPQQSAVERALMAAQPKELYYTSSSKRR